VVEVDSSFQCGDHAIAEWKLTATTQAVPYGSTCFRIPITLRGTSIVRTENGRITYWSDYYDKNRSWRFSFAAFFSEWIEYLKKCHPIFYSNQTPPPGNSEKYA